MRGRPLPLHRRATAVLVALPLTLGAGSLPAAAQTGQAPLIFAGSGSCIAITRILVAAFNQRRPGMRIDVPAGIGSTGGVRAVAEGAVDLGLVTRPLRDGERNLGLSVATFATTALVIAVHPEVSDDEITPEQLVQIYRGIRTRWRDGREIVVLTREGGDSSIEILEREVSGFRTAYAEAQRAKRWMTLFTEQEMHRALERAPGSIGLSDLGSIVAQRLNVRLLKVDGVAPTIENVRNGRYHLVKNLGFVWKGDRIRPETQAFLDFVQSREGRSILRSTGYLPGS